MACPRDVSYRLLSSRPTRQRPFKWRGGSMRWRNVSGLVGTAAAVLAFVAMLPGTAQASFPGQNGKLLLERPEPGRVPTCLWTVNPDGTGLAQTGLCGSPEIARVGARFSP